MNLMSKAKYISRAVFFFLVVILLIYINGKTEADTETVAEFKVKMIEKVRTDSLDVQHKVDLLVDETTKFMDHSSNVRSGMRWLMGLLALFIIVEVIFLIRGKGD